VDLRSQRIRCERRIDRPSLQRCESRLIEVQESDRMREFL
jgi:hypothetical protein